MTPKEKAKELVIKFGDYTVQESWQSKNYFALECALIAVDELIYETQFEVPNIRQRYWQEVKQEIENL
jgi:crotonobetainyl-CoA:carnitine CoA-transferase CaiB-like acyl-CoA transferase